MKDKNLGFTMVELLAAVVILGILMTVAVPAVYSVLNNNRNKTYVEDAIRFTTTMDSNMRSDNKVPIPVIGSCLMMNMAYLNNNTFNDAPYGGEYDAGRSFVVVRQENSGYKYYVRLVEEMSNGSFRGVDLAEVDELYGDEADSKVKNLDKEKAIYMSYYVNEEETVKGILDDYGISCGSLVIYAPDAIGDYIDETEGVEGE